MKKYLVFLMLFLPIYFGIQFISGWILTLIYRPDVSQAWDTVPYLSNDVVIGGSSLMQTIL